MNSQQLSIENQPLTTQELSKRLKVSEASVLKAVLDLGFEPDTLTLGQAKMVQSKLLNENKKALNGDAIANDPKPEETTSDTPDDLVAPGTFSLAVEDDDLLDVTDKAVDDTVNQINDNIDNAGNFKLGIANERIEQASLEGSLQGYLEVAAFENSANAAFLEGLSQLAQVRANAHKQSLSQYSELFQKLGKDTRPVVEETIRNHATTAHKESQTNQEIRSKFRSTFQKKTWVKTATR